MLSRRSTTASDTRFRPTVAKGIGFVLFVVLLALAWYGYVVRTATMAFGGGSSSAPTRNSSAPSAASPTPDTISLPDSLRAQLANFYAAYKQRDSIRLETFFIPDTNQELLDLRSSLFTGIDTKGVAGGTTLFSSTNASEQLNSYSFVSASKSGTAWTVTSSEIRTSASGTVLAPQTLIITFSPASEGSGTWLVNTYSHAGSNAKYNGFLSQ
jgi:hypothetical protein